MKRRRVAVVAVAALSAGCGVGETQPATHVTDVAATLTGKVRNTEDGLTRYRFEYGTTTAYGSATPWRATEIQGTANYASDVAGGLAHGTLYHYRLCAQDETGRGVCGKDETLTTTDGLDSVVGDGVLLDLGITNYAAALDAHSDPGGAAPRGSAWTLPGSLVPRVADSGDVTCLRVEGNRATVGFDITPIIGDDPSGGALVFVKDNGADPDYMTHTTVATAPTTCPAATDDRFLFPAPPGVPPAALPLASGDFQVHDHPDSSSSAF